MKKILVSSLFLLLSSFVFAKTYKVETKGEVFKKDVEGNLVLLGKEDTISDTDIILLGEKASVVLIIDGNKVIIKNRETFTIKELLED